jgi:hypothetical protein
VQQSIGLPLMHPRRQATRPIARAQPGLVKLGLGTRPSTHIWTGRIMNGHVRVPEPNGGSLRAG